MERAAHMVGSQKKIRALKSISDARFADGTIEVLRTSDLDTLPPIGEVNADSGQAAFDAIKKSIECALAGKVLAIVTAPIHKEALSVAGINYSGHTEMLADFSGAEKVAMLLGNDEIRTVLVTIHCSLRDAIKGADYEAQMDAIRLAHQGAIALGFESPRVAVAGLNPHAGEGGLFGQEEIEIIAPAIKAAQAEGIKASGPWPGDTVFMQARKGHFDIVVAQYHDQGLIPVKFMGLEKGVNITLGLPFVRTSPDHGTAFNIAGTGKADASSLVTAIKYADRLVAAKQKGKY
jgi:4-hydroxythreonine-4-phosphate dehydrogenase|tara:strand:+ start:185 stop:1057 length:873 start_codon:yes stop_codon:yes gene_type:complete